MLFQRYIGIDYSGAKTASCRLPGLRAYQCGPGKKPIEICSPNSPQKVSWNWTRTELVEWLVTCLDEDIPTIIGLDHGFSFPIQYFKNYNLSSWDLFLEDFVQHWPMHEPHMFVDFIRDQGSKRIGESNALRLTEKWTANAKSVFLFDVQGAVSKSTHTGIPWLLYLRQKFGDKLHFWPFDGWEVPEGKSVIAEIYPALYKRRYERANRTADQHDAYATACWLEECDRFNRIEYYFKPPLTDSERKIASLEGWILGVC